MKRKRWVIAAVVLVLIGGYTAGIYGQTEDGLTREGLTREQLVRPNEKENKEDIARNVLEDTGRTDLYDMQDLENITVYYGDIVSGNQTDAIVSANFGPKNTVVAAYTPDGNVYEYVGDVGNFYNVRNVQFIPVENLGKDVVVVREFTDESIGSFESTDRIRGYLYDENSFKTVLNTPAKIEASWNAIWDNSALEDVGNWRKITENTESIWRLTEAAAPQLEITRFQNYLISQEENDKIFPEDSTFLQNGSRVITERFFWSDEWRRFVLGEAIEKATGESVAVTENRDASPFTLAGYVENSYRILRKDGTEATVKDNELEWIEKPS